MALGLIARVLWLSAHGVLLDEATVAVGARDIVQNHTNMWDAMSNAPFVWLIGQILGTAGLQSDFLLRLPSALIGVASIPALYCLARRMFNQNIAIVSAFLLALHPFAVAFSRVLFADPFQVFFILIGCYAFDRFATNPWRDIPRKWGLIAYLVFVWGVAFIMKYNAIVPGTIWLLSGVISRRYRIIPAFVAFAAMALGACFTLLIWPYDESVWLLAFMGKAGSYSFSQAAHYYYFKLHLVFFGITEILFAAAFLMTWLLRRKASSVEQSSTDQSLKYINASRSMLHLTLFLLLQTATLVLLGRMFERYLLVLVPFGCVLIIGLLSAVALHMKWDPNRWMFAFMEAKEDKLPKARGRDIAIYFAGYIFIWVFVHGAYQAYSNYFKYLNNDVDYAGLSHTVLSLEQDQQKSQSPRRAFWLVPEPIAAYYLGYTQRYSRAVRPNLDGATANQNYFEFAAVPYSADWRGDKVLAIRRLARQWGISRILASPHRFISNATHVSDSARALQQVPVVDYLSNDFVHTGDMLIMESGFLDLQGEPILEDIANEGGPPYLPTLPLSRYTVYRTYRPEGLAPTTDTTLERVRAGAWLMVHK